MFYVYCLESICPCCVENQPRMYGITKCQNLRVVKHRLLANNCTDLFIKEHSKLFVTRRISHDMSYENAFTLLCSLE